MSTRIGLKEAGGVELSFHDEFSLRDGIARIAYLKGWEVDTEYVIPGWGRPDVYLRSRGLSLAVEVKVELATPSKCRKAIQQASNYRVAMPEVSDVYLVAGHINREAMEPYEAAYPQVTTVTAGEFLHTLSGLARGMQDRHKLALYRFREAERQLEIHRRTLSDLALYVGSPLGVNTAHMAVPAKPNPFELLLEEFRK